jgi:hypothetical protein
MLDEYCRDMDKELMQWTLVAALSFAYVNCDMMLDRADEADSENDPFTDKERTMIETYLMYALTRTWMFATATGSLSDKGV